MKMAGQTQHLVMILLLSLLISFNTVNGSRAAIMIQLGHKLQASKAAPQKKQPLQRMLHGRMDFLYSDYPISEANPRHTPKPPARV